MRRKPGKFRDHHPAPARKRKTTERGLGADWQKFRRHVMENSGWTCIRCWETEGIVEPAKHLHHVIPRSVDMSKRLQKSNVRPLCVACHAIEDKEGNQ